jgi:hypothetical protein
MSTRRMKKAMVSRPRKQGRKPNGAARRSAAVIPRPGPIASYEIVRSKLLRFVCNSSFGGNITFQNLLDCILFTTTATVPYDLFYMVRMKKITIWCLGALGTAETVQVVFDGTTAGSQGDRVLHSSTSMGIEPAFLSCGPKKDTLSANFQISSTANCFQLIVPVGAVIDLMCDYKSDSLGNATAAQNVSVGSDVGCIAYRGLDGLAQATSKFSPPNGVYTI